MVKKIYKILSIFLVISCSKNYDRFDSIFLNEGSDILKNFENKSYQSINCEPRKVINFSSEYSDIIDCENNEFNGNYKISKKINFNGINPKNESSNPIFFGNKLIIIDSKYNLLVFDENLKFKKINSVNLKNIFQEISGNIFINVDKYRLFINTSEGFIASINILDLIEEKNKNIKVFWKNKISAFTIKPLIDNQKNLLFYTQYGDFYLINKETGIIEWKNTQKSEEFSIISKNQPSVLKASNNIFYLINIDKIIRLDAENKKEEIIFSNSYISSTILDGKSITGASNFFLNSLDKYSINSNIIKDQNLMTFSTSNDMIFSIDLKTLNISQNFQNVSTNTGRITENVNQIFLVNQFNKLISITKENKQPIWSQEIKRTKKMKKNEKYSNNIEGPIIIGDEVIIFDKISGKLQRFSEEDGSIIDEIKISKNIDSPIFVNNGKILLVSKKSGKIYIIY